MTSIDEAVQKRVERNMDALPGNRELLRSVFADLLKFTDQGSAHIFADYALLSFIDDPEVTMLFNIFDRGYKK